MSQQDLRLSIAATPKSMGPASNLKFKKIEIDSKDNE